MKEIPDRALRERLQRVRWLFYDFDGVMTDNRVLVDQHGVESVYVNRSDGLAVSRLKAAGYGQVIVSTEKNPVVERRAEKLKIPVIHGVEDKGEIIRRYRAENGIDREETLFIGNDVNDLAAYAETGVHICPADAYEEIREQADLVLSAKGGYGVIRELMAILQASQPMGTGHAG